MKYLGPDPCPHRRVQAMPAKIVPSRPGRVVEMTGHCLDCGAKVARRTDRLAFGDWRSVPGAEPAPRRRPDLYRRRGGGGDTAA